MIQYFTKAHTPCLFFFCDYTECNTHLPILCALIRQASSQLDSIPKEVRDSFEQHARHQTQPGHAEVMLMLSAVIVRVLKSAKKVFIVVDGIDELEHRNCGKLLKAILELASSFAPSVSVMISSRHDYRLRDELASAGELVVGPQTSDIESYVNTRLNSGYLTKVLGDDIELKVYLLRTVVERRRDQ